MSSGSKIYGAYMRENQADMRARKKSARKRIRGAAGICPFTLEAIKDCVVRKRSPRTACRYSLEDCLAPR